MADFTCAIAVRLASPTRSVATSKRDTEHTLRPQIIGSGRHKSKWYASRRASIDQLSVGGCADARSLRASAGATDHDDATHQSNVHVQNSPTSECYLAPI